MSYVYDIRVQHQLYLHSADLRLILLWYILYYLPNRQP